MTSTLPPTYAYVTGEVKQHDYCPYGKRDYWPDIQPPDYKSQELEHLERNMEQINACAAMSKHTSIACEISTIAGEIARELGNAAVRAAVMSLSMFRTRVRMVMALIMISGMGLMVSSALLLDGMDNDLHHDHNHMPHMPHVPLFPETRELDTSVKATQPDDEFPAHPQSVGPKVVDAPADAFKSPKSQGPVVGRNEEHTLRISSGTALAEELQRQFALFVASPHDSL